MPEFAKYIQHTKNVCMYRLHSQHIHPSISFPNASILTLIRCSPVGITNILKQSIFPNLKTIHYLSLHPGDYLIHNRFNNLKWVFPTKSYSFYDCMVQAGHGKKDPQLISTYVTDKKQSHSYTEFNLQIPGYHVTDGELYWILLMNYISSIDTHVYYKPDTYKTLQECSTYNPHYTYYKNKIDSDFFNIIEEESSHLDATLFHSSNK